MTRGASLSGSDSHTTVVASLATATSRQHTSQARTPSGLGPIGPSGDVYTLPHFQVDAQASHRVFRGLSAVVSGLNLNNEVFGYYTGSTQFVNPAQ